MVALLRPDFIPEVVRLNRFSHCIGGFSKDAPKSGHCEDLRERAQTGNKDAFSIVPHVLIRPACNKVIMSMAQ